MYVCHVHPGTHDVRFHSCLVAVLVSLCTLFLIVVVVFISHIGCKLTLKDTVRLEPRIVIFWRWYFVVLARSLAWVDRWLLHASMSPAPPPPPPLPQSKASSSSPTWCLSSSHGTTTRSRWWQDMAESMTSPLKRNKTAMYIHIYVYEGINRNLNWHNIGDKCLQWRLFWWCRKGFLIGGRSSLYLPCPVPSDHQVLHCLPLINFKWHLAVLNTSWFKD